MKINPKIAEALDMDLPEDEGNEDEHIGDGGLVSIEPHELPVVDNPDLPSMIDTEKNLLQGEKQLQMIIQKGMSLWDSMNTKTEGLEPKYVNRHIETMTGLLGTVLDAVKHNNELQLKKKDARMKEANFSGKGNADSGTTNNFFMSGTREEILQRIKDMSEDK